ncbi:hypothetical protein GBAR_LOCUS30428 [Geodia barretti]|uniref:Uncharacterized protein n=1 Tax=Geodia barretti TaxID=519541 RepID=A0AA35TZA1_GEOBA|nr:hypothetical protein GBAR_LOCUS30428 [Geodia barretti]
MSRSGLLRPVVPEPGAGATQRSATTSVVPGLPKCWIRWWLFPSLCRWS